MIVVLYNMLNGGVPWDSPTVPLDFCGLWILGSTALAGYNIVSIEVADNNYYLVIVHIV